MKIRNTFRDTDTLNQRVEKLNRQTGLRLHVARIDGDSFALKTTYRKFFTGWMTRAELMHWTATFALGFRTAMENKKR